MNAKWIINHYLLIPLISISGLLLAYSKLSVVIGGIGHGFGKGLLTEIKLELLLVALSYYAIFFSLKSNRYRHALSLLPVLAFYLFYDYYFISFGKVFKFCDVSELPELIDILPAWQLSSYSLIVVGLMLLLIINTRIRWQSAILPVTLLTTLLIITVINPNNYLRLFKTVSSFSVTDWSDEYTAQNGYISAVLYFAANMSHAKTEANNIPDTDLAYEQSQAQLMQFLAEKGNHHNVHIILLESFFNPKSFSRIHYNGAPYHSEFTTLIKQQESVVISPVFGGFTAQAEFEVLCGVPALQKYNSVEFNGFTGAKTFCLPSLLQDYRGVASNSYKPNFFNTPNADKGMGFKEIYFPQQYASNSNTYLSLVDDEKFMFDGDLFTQNLQFVKHHITTEARKPLFNYVLGVYGHMPFTINETRHPRLLKAQLHNKILNDEYQRAVNQIVYRTQALAYYLTALIKLDPHSLIIVMGDHVPRLGGTPFYQTMGYRNNSQDSIHKPPAFYIVNARFIKKQELHQYDIMNVIFNYLTDNAYCHVYSCQRSQQNLLNSYRSIMARALK